MKTHILCFSPTGGTQKVVDILAEEWGGACSTCDLSDPSVDFGAQRYGEQDMCVIGVPSFGGRVPAVAVERLAAVRGDGATAVLVATYGNRAYEDTLLELADTARASGFAIAAAVAAATEHSIMRRFGTGRPDAKDEGELRDAARRIAAVLDVAEPGRLTEPALPGDRPFRAYKGVPFTPKTGKACTACGACVRSCPVGAIPLDEPSLTDKQACISCMRCVATCPRAARALNPVALFVAGKKMAKSCGGRKPNELFLA